MQDKYLYNCDKSKLPVDPSTTSLNIFCSPRLQTPTPVPVPLPEHIFHRCTQAELDAQKFFPPPFSHPRSRSLAVKLKLL